MEEILLFLRRLKNSVGSSSDVDTMTTVFGRLAEIKKISAERRMQIAATLGLMDVEGLSDLSTAKELADGLDSIPINSKEASVLTTNGQVREIPRGYHHQGGQVKTDIANLTPSNIKKGVNVGGVIGTHSPSFSMVYKVVTRAGTETVPGKIAYINLGRYHTFNSGSSKYPEEYCLDLIDYTNNPVNTTWGLQYSTAGSSVYVHEKPSVLMKNNESTQTGYSKMPMTVRKETDSTVRFEGTSSTALRMVVKIYYYV